MAHRDNVLHGLKHFGLEARPHVCNLFVSSYLPLLCRELVSLESLSLPQFVPIQAVLSMKGLIQRNLERLELNSPLEWKHLEPLLHESFPALTSLILTSVSGMFPPTTTATAISTRLKQLTLGLSLSASDTQTVLNSLSVWFPSLVVLDLEVSHHNTKQQKDLDYAPIDFASLSQLRVLEKLTLQLHFPVVPFYSLLHLPKVTHMNWHLSGVYPPKLERDLKRIAPNATAVITS